jgi:hypothetical protein
MAGIQLEGATVHVGNGGVLAAEEGVGDGCREKWATDDEAAEAMGYTLPTSPETPAERIE